MTAESAIKQLKRMATDKERTGDEYNAIMYAIEEIECNRTVPKSYVSINRVLEIIDEYINKKKSENTIKNNAKINVALHLRMKIEKLKGGEQE